MDTVPYMEKGFVFPVYNILLLPGVSTMIYYSQEPSGLKEALQQERPCLLLPIRRDASKEDITKEDFYRYGVSFTNGQLAANEKGTYFSARLMNRVQIFELYQENGQWIAEYTTDREQADLDEKGAGQMLSYMKETVGELASHFKNGEVYTKMMDNIHDLNTMIAYLSQFLPLSAQERYELLEMDSLKKRGLTFMDILLKQKETLEVNLELREKISDKTSRAYRRQILQEQMKAIQEELDEEDSDGDEEEESYQSRIERAHLPAEIEKAALKEAKKLDSMGMGNSEENIIRNYLDFLLSLPWERTASEAIDLKKASAILNADHYGLEKVKERILQHLAVMKLKEGNRGSILLLVGPPGTGKTSLGKSIARALGREYVRLSLGGIHDEAEIRGHRRTYIGALPGSILKSMQKAGTTDPVMVLDEVDKLQSGGYNGDPASAMLEVLDPEQNSVFSDHYIEEPYDLSKVLFIATANYLENIPAALRDRLEIIELSSYTELEKVQIAKEHLLPKQLEENGLKASQLKMDEEMILYMIRYYTRESGVRQLERTIATICRKSVLAILKDHKKSIRLSKKLIREWLGNEKVDYGKRERKDQVGTVTGLAYTSFGGDVLQIEVNKFEGKGKLVLTGQLGDVMKESASIALDYIRANAGKFKISSDIFEKTDIHIHVPEGAVPKDGPSAGVTMTTALVSCLSDTPVRSDVAMTGEVTLRGNVLPIGGLKEKSLAAHRSGISTVIIPKGNVKDLDDIPQTVKEAMKFVPVERVTQVLDVALVR